MAEDSFFDDKSILLLDAEKKDTNDRTWSFWDKETTEWRSIIEKTWKKIAVKNKVTDREALIDPYEYYTIRSSKFYDFIWKVIKQKRNFVIKRDTVLNISHRSEFGSVLTKTQEYHGSKVFNSILFDKRYNQQSKYPVLRQHFLGWFVKTEQEIFDEETVTFMDFSVKQRKNTRFMYVLPFSKTEALVEYTLFSKRLLPKDEYENAIRHYLDQKGITDYRISEKEIGVIPMTSYQFWKQNSSNVLYIGTAGGWTKASTGYTFKNSSKKTKQLISFLKKEDNLKKFQKKSRFWWYDLLFLDVLFKRNDLGSSLFVRLFKRNPPNLILKFLDEETSFFEELRIMLSMPAFRFIEAIIQRIKG